MVFGPGVMQGGLIIALAVSLLSIRETGPTIKLAFGSLLAGMAAVVLIAWMPSVFTSIEPLRSLEAWARIPLLMLGAVLLWSPLKNDPALHALSLKALLCSGFFAAVVAIFVLNGGNLLLLSLQGQDIFYTPTKPLKAYSNISMCLIPVVLWAGHFLKGRWQYAALGMICLNLVVIAQTGTGAAVAGLLAGGALVGFLAALKGKKFLFAYFGVLAAAIAGTLSWLADKMNPEVPSPNIFPNWLVDGHRQYIWQFAYEKIWESPWLGYGINAIDRIPGAKDHIPGIEHPYIPSHPHNAYLEVGAETGLVGLAVLVLVLIFFALRLVSQYLACAEGPLDQRLHILALLFLWVGFWSSSALNFSLWSAWWELTLFTSLALLLATPSRKQN